MKTTALQLVRSDIAEQEFHLAQLAKKYFETADADNTKKAYRSDWRHFFNWCQAHSRTELPATAETLTLYLSDCAKTDKVSTIKRRMAAINKAHKQFDFTFSPNSKEAVRTCLKGIKRKKGIASLQKKPILTEHYQAIIERLRESLQDRRDKALLLIGYAGTFRRSELVSLNVEDLDFTHEGVVITLRKSKTDQTGEGIKKAICSGENEQTCPVRALLSWLHAAGIESGPVFRSFDIHQNLTPRRLCSKSVALIIKKHGAKIGLDVKNISGHSLRSGSVTQAAINGVPDSALMKQGGWSSPAMIGRYIRDANLFRNNLSSSLGL